MKIELTKEETEQIIMMIENSNVQIKIADKALILLEKFKDARSASGA